MSLKSRLLGSLFSLLALAPPAFAQVFWSNYSPSGVTDAIWGTTYADGTFAAVTDQGNLLTSSNGSNWSSQGIDSGVWLVSIAYGNGTWVVVGDNGTILASPDLKTWTHATSATSNRLNGVAYVGGIWVAVGESGTIVTSLDAVNWVLQPAIPGITGFLHGITGVPENTLGIGAGIWICGQNGALIWGTANGGSTNYTFSSYTGPQLGSQLPFSANLEAILYPWAASANSLAQSPSLVGVGQQFFFYSDISVGHPPGQTFAASPTAAPAVDFRGLTYGNGYFVAAGANGTIFRSTDGINWVQSYAGDSPSTLSTATFLSAAYSSSLQRFVVTGTGGTILVSNPPPTVFANVSTRGYVGGSSSFIGGFVIEGSAPRTVLIRADGPVLATFGVPSPLSDPVLTVYDSKQNVVATNTGWTTNASPATLSQAALEVGAFALPNPGSDSALLLVLPPGAYTAVITSAGNNSGSALFEAYTN